MAYIGFVRNEDYLTALSTSAGDAKLHFPTDSPSIIMRGDEYGAQRGCSKTLTTLQGVPLNYPCALATISADDTLYLASAPTEGRTYRILVYNSGSSAVNVTVSTSSNITSQLILMKGSAFGSGDGMTTTTVTISISASHGIVMSLTRFGTFMVLEV